MSWRRRLAGRTRRKLYQEVADELLEMVRGDDYPPGARIPTETELADMFEVSRTAVREGVKSLVAIGVLETQRGRGTFVRDAQPGPLRYFNGPGRTPSLALLQDLLEFRLIVEPETAALAAERRDQSDIGELERCVLVLKEAVVNGVGVKPAEDLGFHLALARATANSALIDTSSMIARFYESDPYPPDETDVDEHRAIFEAVRDAESAGARNAMRVHLQHQLDKYQASTDSSADA